MRKKIHLYNGLKFWEETFLKIFESPTLKNVVNYTLLFIIFYIIAAASFNGFFAKWAFRDGQKRHSFENMYSPQKNQLYAIEVNTRPNGTRYLTTATCGVNSLCELINMAIGEFSLSNVYDKLEYFYSTEIPVGDYGGPSPNEPVKSFEYNDFVVHGPVGYQRVTARAESKENLQNLVEKLI